MKYKTIPFLRLSYFTPMKGKGEVGCGKIGVQRFKVYQRIILALRKVYHHYEPEKKLI
ncbi:MAG: hypothetical protein ACXACU_13190 [Candidatus Hodarchaeales archaeon]